MINERLLKYDQLRVVTADGESLGVLNPREAIEKAKEAELDLVLIAAHADPPVAKIIDHGKYKYEQAKLKKENRRKVQEVKGVKLRPGTQEHDLQVLVRNAQKFLSEGDKVRIVCQFRRRELDHPAIGKEKLKWVAEQLEEHGKLDREPVLNGREMVMVVSPKSGAK